MSVGNPETGWFDSLGEEVPEVNRELAREKARSEMDLKLSEEDMDRYIDSIAVAIEEDCPEDAIPLSRTELDVTGAFRLLAYLCVGPTEDTEGESE